MNIGAAILYKIIMGNVFDFTSKIILSNKVTPVTYDCELPGFKVIFFYEQTEDIIYYKKLKGSKTISEGYFSQQEMKEELKQVASGQMKVAKHSTFVIYRY